jgi:hypothetical protein
MVTLTGTKFSTGKFSSRVFLGEDGDDDGRDDDDGVVDG